MIRTVHRAGRRVLVIDFKYIDPTGRPARYRRDASVQTLVSARAEDKRLQALASETGSPVARSDSFRESTRVRYRALLKQLGVAFGSKRLGDITPMQLRAHSTELKRRGVNPRGHENLLRTVFRTAVESGALAVAPEVPRLGTAGRKLPDAPDAAEVAALLKRAGSHWIRPAIALAAYAGLRQGEVRALEVQDVDLKAGVLRIRRALSESELTTPKSGHARLVPIATPLRTILEPALRGKLPRARVVVNFAGRTPARQQVLAALKEATGTTRSFHSLRHAFVSMLVRAGCNIEAARDLAGHSSVVVTNRYAHATGEDLRRAMVGMGEEQGE